MLRGLKKEDTELLMLSWKMNVTYLELNPQSLVTKLRVEEWPNMCVPASVCNASFG
jgi:hypothetical protein